MPVELFIATSSRPTCFSTPKASSGSPLARSPQCSPARSPRRFLGAAGVATPPNGSRIAPLRCRVPNRPLFWAMSPGPRDERNRSCRLAGTRRRIYDPSAAMRQNLAQPSLIASGCTANRPAQRAQSKKVQVVKSRLCIQPLKKNQVERKGIEPSALALRSGFAAP